MKDIINNFLNSWYGTVTILGTVFLILTGKSLNSLIKKLKVVFKGRGVEVSSGETQKEQKEKIPRKDLKEIAKLLSKLGIKDPNELDNFLRNLFSKLSSKEQTIQQKENIIKRYSDIIINLFEAFEFYRFSYLNLYLVHNSKLALGWFYIKRAATKEFFILNFPLPPSIANQNAEKEAIFNALLFNRLIEPTGTGLYRVSIIGKRFLKFIGFIKNDQY